LTRRFLGACLIPCLFVLPLASCGPSYSPDTYATAAAQQANKTEQGTIIGVRPVRISAAGTVGTVTGAAAGGIAGSQAASGGVAAFTALGGSLVGGIAGSAVEHATSDTDAFEYIIKKTNNDLVSVTQKDAVPLVLGQKVLVIAGNQARVVPDYTVTMDNAPAKPDSAARPSDVAKAPASVEPAKADMIVPASSEPAKSASASPDQAKSDANASVSQSADKPATAPPPAGPDQKP
jgi:outer membrane lipoprotein SlyB